VRGEATPAVDAAPVDPPSSGPGSWGLPLAVAVLACFFVGHVGMIQIPGMDAGVLVNASWMASQGMVPYRDFLTAVPPAFVLGGELAFRLLGPSWRSLVQLTGLWAAGALLLQWALLRALGMGRARALLLATTCIALVWLPIGWWWYNQFTASIVLLLLTAALVLSEQPQLRWPRAAFVVLTAGTCLAKVSLAPFALVASAVIVATGPARRRAFGLLLAGAALALLVLLVSGISPIGLLDCYRDAAGRLGDRRFDADRWAGLARPEGRRSLLLAGLLLVTALFPQRRASGPASLWAASPWSRRWLLLSALGVTLVALWVDNDHKSVATAILAAGVGAVLLMRTGPRSVVAMLLLGAMVVHGAELSLSRARTAGQPFHESVTPASVASKGVMAGVLGGPQLTAVEQDLAELPDLLGQWSVRSGELFVGPRIDWAYASLGLRPPAGLPLWWESYGDPAKPRAAEVIARFRSRPPRAAVILTNDLTFLPGPVIQLFVDQYVVIQKRATQVLVRRDVLPPDAAR